ncbi:golgin subfamily A member 6-like protein 10 [Drosophila miranda]|uniref:golgin subfamily A member 6-like protein 10 n=1 Tax=Drosophila miranda TaxID=7229 RepID=UPI00143F0756|nr:golgin subfamily A member 6-like protein 10 [Drosophila miranda]XP_033253987.1 golgin subfamily A member 6-like protein 10 [Drosophila miranda]XP_033255358.1 golgin subfamily A member 6-like protein 10 [Drosophila miranda]XP_033255616.1 golgin subfamily A member 6-like protein 10 [Drosophila miranda]
MSWTSNTLLIDLHHEQEQNSLRLRTRNNELETMISELQEKLKLTEIQLDANDQREEQLHSDLEIVKMELFRSEQVTNQLCSKEEHLGRVFEKLNRQEEKLRRLEELTDVSSNDNARLLKLRDRQHEKNIQMDWEIS